MIDRMMSGKTALKHFGLLSLVVLFVILILFFSGWGLSNQFRKYVVQQIRAELLVHLDNLTAQFTIDANGNPALFSGLGDPRFSSQLSGLYWQIDRLNDKGETLNAGILRSPSLQDYTLKLPDSGMSVGVITQRRIIGPLGNETLRTLENLVSSTPIKPLSVDDESEPALPENVRIRQIVAVDEQLALKAFDDINGTIWQIFSVLALIIIVGETIQIFLLHLPLQHFYQSLEAVCSGQSKRIEGGYFGKLQMLADEFNHLLEQNAKAVEGVRKQAGDFVKAVNPPLDNMARAAAEPEQTVTALSSVVTTQVSVARQQINYQFAQSQAIALDLKAKLRCEVFPVLENMVRRMEKVYPDKHLKINIHMQKPSPFFRGEMLDLRSLLGNLLDKAFQWAESRVEIQLVSTERQILVVIEDDGLGMAASQDGSQTKYDSGTQGVAVPGADMGVAEIRELLSWYNGKLEQRNSRLGGMQARLTLPRAS